MEEAGRAWEEALMRLEAEDGAAVTAMAMAAAPQVGGSSTEKHTGCTRAVKLEQSVEAIQVTGHLQMYMYSPFVVTSSASGEPRPVYGGLYTVGGYGEGYFFPTWVAA
ncbi:uncharacterized protein [Lolium perenne]|uniref:uncharacterized protein n=1 Tax=Lolium perenne TaxID=4522 RepID=UPI0021F5AD03|nr:uncharacterized protein LOC127324176 [Lolium perenne]